MSDQLPFDESVLRLKDNEVRFDEFINDAVGYLTREGVSVESIQAFLARLEDEVTGYIALGPRVDTLETGMGAVEGRLDDLEAFGLDARVTSLETSMVEVLRRLMTPSEWVSYLPVGSDFTTASFSAGVLTKLLIPTTVKFSEDFGIIDIGGGDMRVQYQGPTARRFRVHMSTGLQTGTSNTIIKLRMFRGTVATPDVIELGVGIARKVGTGSDTGAIGFASVFVANPLDVIAIAAETSLASTLTFIETSIIIEEDHGPTT